MTTLRRERIQKFEKIVLDWLLVNTGMIEITCSNEELEKIVSEHCEALADASLSRSEIAGEYKTGWDSIKTDVANVIDETTNVLMRGDWREYPEHLHEVAKCLRDTWMFVLPEKPKKKEKSKYSGFVSAMELIKQSCGEFGIKVLEETHKKWRAGFKDGIAPYTIAQPTSLINVTNATALEMRQAGNSNTNTPIATQDKEKGFYV